MAVSQAASLHQWWLPTSPLRVGCSQTGKDHARFGWRSEMVAAARGFDPYGGDDGWFDGWRVVGGGLGF